MPAHRVARHGMVRTFQLTKSLARLTVLDNLKLGATGQRGRGVLRQPRSPAVERPGGRRGGPRRGPPRAVQPGPHARRVRRLAVGRPAQAARDGPGPDGAAHDGDARRAHGRREPRPHAVPPRAREGPAHGGDDGDVRGARHGRRPRHLRLGRRDGRGAGDRRGHPGPDQQQRRRHRRLPGLASRRPAHRGRGAGPARGDPSRDRGRGGRRTMADERALPEVQIDLEPDDEETWNGPLLVARSIVAGYVARRRHPPRLRAGAREGRAGRHHRTERRRQVHPPEGDVRPRPGALGLDRAARPGHHPGEGPPPGGPRRRLRAAEQQRVPQPHGAGEPRDGALPAPQGVRGSLRGGVRPLPAARSAPQAAGRARCRAASARWWPWAGR